MSGEYVHRETCRICGSRSVCRFLSLCEMPLANAFLRKEDLERTELVYPLDVYFCDNCGLVQLMDVVLASAIFNENYAYFTGASEPMKKHFHSLAREVMHKNPVGPDSLVVDVGGGDGTLLEGFLGTGAQLLVVDPASNVTKVAAQKGMDVSNRFFNEETARVLASEYGKAEIIMATNVLAHTDDLNGFAEGLSLLLADGGAAIIEVPYLGNLIANTEFDSIYHEHYSYLAARPLVFLFRKYGMVITDIKKIPVHGGSLRLFILKGNEQGMAVDDMLLDEWGAGLHHIETYMDFDKRVQLLKEDLRAILKKLKKEGKRITGYGATAKGNTLLNYCKIGTDILDFITDTTPFKQGRYTPGMHIPIFPEDKFHEDAPDYALLLAWNYADTIVPKEKNYLRNGGHFIIPIPEPRVI